jgi:hypothetical protein
MDSEATGDGYLHNLPEALRAVGLKVTSEEFVGEVQDLLKTGCDLDIRIKVQRRPGSKDYRVILQRMPCLHKTQLLCLTRLNLHETPKVAS